MAFAILHVEKLKQNNTKSIIYHNKRDIKNTETKQNIDFSKSQNNIYFGMTKEELLNEYKTNLKPQCFRANIVPMVEVILSFSPDYECNVKDWFKANQEYMNSIFGENVLSMDLHLDEKTPHIHCLVKPIVNEKLNAKAFITRGLLKSMQNNYHRFLKERGFNLERGVENSSVRHTNQKEYSHSVNKALKETAKNKAGFVNGLVKDIELRFNNKSAIQMSLNKKEVVKEIKETVVDYCNKNFDGYSNALNELLMSKEHFKQQAKVITNLKDRIEERDKEKLELMKENIEIYNQMQNQKIEFDIEIEKQNKIIFENQQPVLDFYKLENELNSTKKELEETTSKYKTTLKAFNELKQEMIILKQQSKTKTLK